MSDDQLVSPETEAAAIAAGQAAYQESQKAVQTSTQAPTEPQAAPDPAPQTPDPAPETPDASIRARQQSQRLREAARSEAELAARARQDAESRAQSLAAKEKELAEALDLVKKDPAGFLKKHDLNVEDLIRAKFDETKGQYDQAQLRREIEALKKAQSDAVAAEQQRQEAIQVEQSQISFVKTAMNEEDYPNIVAWYDTPEDLIHDAYRIQGQFVRQFNRPPSSDEIAMNLDAQLKERYARMQGRQQSGDSEGNAPAPAQKATDTKKRTLPANGKSAPTQAIDRSKLSDEELEQLAIREAQKEIDRHRPKNGAG